MLPALEDRRELAAAVVGLDLPPAELWERLSSRLSPDLQASTLRFWRMVGLKLDAYFGDHQDPTQEMLLSGHISSQEHELYSVWGNYYGQLSLLVFQAESMVKQAAKKEGIPYPFKRRSELLKALFWEDCARDLTRKAADFWDSPSTKTQQDLLGQFLNILQGGVALQGKAKPATPENIDRAWDKVAPKVEKLQSGKDLLSGDHCQWNELLLSVVREHQAKLPAFNGFLSAVQAIAKFNKKAHRQHVYTAGSLRIYSARGKSKNAS